MIRPNKFLEVSGLAVCALLLAACVQTPVLIPDDEPVFPYVSPDAEAPLRPGDIVDVVYRFWPELDSEELPIRADGRVSLQLVGQVVLGGLTPRQADEYLNELYADKLRDPDITLVVRAVAPKQIYVAGEVLTPGVVLLSYKMTPLQAIMAAGGFDKRSAELESVVIVRHLNEQRFATSLDFTRVAGVDPSLYLAPSDVIFVPRNKIDKVNQWVDQHINEVVPDSVNFSIDVVGAGALIDSSD